MSVEITSYDTFKAEHERRTRAAHRLAMQWPRKLRFGRRALG
jgi:hypothetical protein